MHPLNHQRKLRSNVPILNNGSTGAARKFARTITLAHPTHTKVPTVPAATVSMIVSANMDFTSLPMKPNASDTGGVLGGKYLVVSTLMQQRSSKKQENLRKQKVEIYVSALKKEISNSPRISYQLKTVSIPELQYILHCRLQYYERLT
jgi:hypothetical protein